VVKRKIKGEDILTRTMARGRAYINEVVKEQESIVEAAEKRIRRINSEVDALRYRLKPYFKEKVPDEKYHDLKHDYERLLVERATLQRAIVVAQESIEAAKLHTIE
jgi:hypothetical protein